MKKDIHPTYYKDAKVICACGNTFTTGSTVKELHVEICSTCHPFYTGKQKLLDTARRVEKFEEKMANKEKISKARKGKKTKHAERAKKQTKKTPEIITDKKTAKKPASVSQKAKLQRDDEK